MQYDISLVFSVNIQNAGLNVSNISLPETNAPHKAWKRVKTFPRHFHEGYETNVVESKISSMPKEAIREFFEFIKGIIS